jgi:hypothetical protein
VLIDDLSTRVEGVHIAGLYLGATPFHEKSVLEAREDRRRSIGTWRRKRLHAKELHDDGAWSHVDLARFAPPLLHVCACAAQGQKAESDDLLHPQSQSSS